MNTPNDQYVPPTFYNPESPLVPAPAELEKNHEWGDFIHSIQHAMEHFRNKADRTVIDRYENRGPIKKMAAKAFSMPYSAEALTSRLINIEAFVFGKELPYGPNVTSQMFWYFQDDWFYQVTEGSKASGFTAMTARYQVRNNELIKSVGATPVPLGDGEMEAFTVWVQQYHALHANGLYKGIDDIAIDDQLDYLMDDVNQALSRQQTHGPRSDYDLAA